MSDFVPNIGSAYKPYEVRSSDARMEKKPYDKFQENRRRGSGKFKNKNTSREEKTSLSISALILFLESHLSDQDTEIIKKSSELRKESYLAPWMRTTHSNGNNKSFDSKKAVNAYQHAAETSQPSPSDATESLNSGNGEIYMLLQDLKSIQRDGIKTLRIETGPSFLDGIFNAVDLLKTDHTPNL